MLWYDGVLEVSGGLVGGVLKLMPTSGTWRRPGGAAALTLGHVVFALDRYHAARTRVHERVHVRQYERWGPLFLPAYGLASLMAETRGPACLYRQSLRDRSVCGIASGAAGAAVST